MIERDGFDGPITFCCDECGELDDTRCADFASALSKVKSHGWKVRKDGGRLAAPLRRLLSMTRAPRPILRPRYDRHAPDELHELKRLREAYEKAKARKLERAE